ncbi:hypothetical protein LDENG_00235950 [Lucifuga dentata]|nr:hypothetical protein LDENG_00235950 [Lucifuga dentata]
MYGDGEGAVWDRVGRPRQDCTCYFGPTTLMPMRSYTPHTLRLFSPSSGMRKSPDVSPRRLSDISPQLRQLKYLVVDESIKEDLKSSRSVEDINSASIEERILRITGYYGYQPWSNSCKIWCGSKTTCTTSGPQHGPQEWNPAMIHDYLSEIIALLNSLLQLFN